MATDNNAVFDETPVGYCLNGHSSWDQLQNIPKVGRISHIYRKKVKPGIYITFRRKSFSTKLENFYWRIDFMNE